MRHFFTSPDNIAPEDQRAYIKGEDVHHISRVLRLQPGDGLILLDGLGHEYQARIISISPEQVVTAIENTAAAAGEPPIEVSLIQGLTKGDKMELIVQKCTELGVKAIYPVESARTVVRLSEDKGHKKQQRWQRIALEAAKQCRRPVVPLIHQPSDLKTVLSKLGRELFVLMPWEEEKSVGIKKALGQSINVPEVALLIGPEGGWSSEEAAVAKAHGAVTVHLGPRILRSETAGMAALTMVLYAWGDLGG